jgi:hypothetical protein
VRLFNGALSDAGIQNIFTNRNVLPNSGFVITSVTRAADGSVTITFPTTPGKTYLVEGSTTMGTWLQLSANASSPYTLQAGNPTLNPATATRIFMRVKEN